MRRRSVLLFASVSLFLGAGLFVWQGLPSAQTNEPVRLHRPTLESSGPRVVLTAGQQREAAAAGGFAWMPKSLLRVERPMRYGDWIWNDESVSAGPTFVRIDLRTQLLSVFRAGHEIGTSVILYGADAKETPIGRFPILWKGKDHRSSLYDAPMPFTLRLTGDGVAIHGSNVRWGAATHGCIGVPTEFARNLYGAMEVGDPVMVLRSSAAGQGPLATR